MPIIGLDYINYSVDGTENRNCYTITTFKLKLRYQIYDTIKKIYRKIKKIVRK